MMKPVLIAPSILGADLMNLGSEIRAVEAGGADMIHFDVMDGRFVPEISFGELLMRRLKPFTTLPLDVHLMVEKPEQHMQTFIQGGADRLTVHLESTEELPEILKVLHAQGVAAGISICPETPVEAVFPYLDAVSSILVMTVHPGYGGQKFMEESLPRIRTLRREIDRQGRSVYIAVDGGIRTDTAISCRDAGADFFVCGTFVFRNDRAENIRALRAVLTKESGC